MQTEFIELRAGVRPKYNGGVRTEERDACDEESEAAGDGRKRRRGRHAPVVAKKLKRKPRVTGWVLPLPRKHKGKIPLKVIRAAVRKAIAELRAEMAAKGIVLKPWRPEDADENGEVNR